MDIKLIAYLCIY